MSTKSNQLRTVHISILQCLKLKVGFLKRHSVKILALFFWVSSKTLIFFVLNWLRGGKGAEGGWGDYARFRDITVKKHPSSRFMAISEINNSFSQIVISYFHLFWKWVKNTKKTPSQPRPTQSLVTSSLHCSPEQLKKHITEQESNITRLRTWGQTALLFTNATDNELNSGLQWSNPAGG